MISISTVVTQGWDIIPVEIQAVRFARSFPQVIIQGLPPGKAREVRDRLLAALRSQQLTLDRARYVVVITPSLTATTWASNCEGMLLLLLCCLQGVISSERVKELCVISAINIDGSLRLEKDWFRQLEALKKEKDKKIILPIEAASLLDKTYVRKHKILFARTLGEIIGERYETSVIASAKTVFSQTTLASRLFPSSLILPFMLTITGGHHLLLYGSPGEGKTYSRQVLRYLGEKMYSPCTKKARLPLHAFLTAEDQETTLQTTSPHHTSSQIFGSLHPFSLGSVSRAHHVWSFWDELPEFSRSTLVTLRQIFDTREISLQGKSATTILPADTTVVATANPCPCGYYGYPQCRCNDSEVRRYQQRFLGPLADRFHVFIRYPHGSEENISSTIWEQWLERGKRARQRGRWRARHHLTTPWIDNTHLTIEDLELCLQVPEKWLAVIAEWSLRRKMIFQQVSLTLADLADREPSETDFFQAYQYTKVPKMAGIS